VVQAGRDVGSHDSSTTRDDDAGAPLLNRWMLAADKTHPVPTIGMTIGVIVCIALIMATPFSC
jgi:hypothetical protein